MSILKENNGKWSSTRIVILATVIIVLSIVVAKVFYKIDVSDALILGLFGEACALIIASKVSKNGNKTPEDNNLE